MSASDLARRWAALVADGRGRWLDGMRGQASGGWDLRVGTNFDSADIGSELPGSYILDDDILRHCDGLAEEDFDGAVPVWDDPATLGCLRALVQLAHGLPHASAVRVCIGAGSRESSSFPKGAK